MSVQELLTYVEELSFKTSMIGYDKDEVDIQLDKICDEIEAIVREKDDEIAALRSGHPQAPVVVDLNQKEETEAPEERTVEVFGKRKDSVQDMGINAQDGGEGSASKIDALQKEIVKLRGQLTASEEELSAYKKQYEQLLSEKEAVQTKLDQVEEELEEADARAFEAERYAQTAQEKIESLEDREPQNKDEAYQLYMKNADLLCKQLAAVDAQKEAAFEQARGEAAVIVEEADAEKVRILDEARAGADQIASQAEEERDKTQKDIERMIEEDNERKKQVEAEYQELLEKKDSLVRFMKDISGDITKLIAKAER